MPTWAGFLFLAVVIDVWSRRVAGRPMASHLKTDLVLAALDMAVTRRQPTSVTHHSDRGTAATSCPSLKGRRVSPHTLRHTTAMHLLQSGVT